MNNDNIPWQYVALIIIAFITWLFNRIQEATAERRRLKELKRRRGEQQAAPAHAAPSQTRRSPSRPAEQPEDSAEDILHDLFEALGGKPRTPPPLPREQEPEHRERPRARSAMPTASASPSRRQPEPPQPVKAPEERLSAAERAALDRLKQGATPMSGDFVPPKTGRQGGSAQELRRLLRSRGGLRQAVVLKEILDTPLALRDDPMVRR